MEFGAKPTEHTNLFLELDRQLTDKNFQDLKQLTTSKEYGNFKPGELEKIKTNAELFMRLEHKRIISVGDYKKLKKMLDAIGLKHLINDCVQKVEEKLQRGGHPVKRERDHEESPYGAVAMETEGPPPSINNNNTRMLSQSSFEDAMPSDIAEPRQEPDDRPRYPRSRGYVLFINNFVETQKLRRIGCNKDAQNIEEFFDDELEYKFVKYEDLTKAKLLRVLEETKTKLQNGNFDKFILIVCSHGGQYVVNKDNSKLTEERIMMVDDKSITEEELLAPFMGDKLKQFEGKPKVFIVQACRAPQPDKSDAMSETPQQYADGDSGPPSLRSPVNSDVLISYATTKGTKAWRNEADGSWFIHHFCDISKRHYKQEHLMDLLVRVNNEVAKMVSTEDSAKQMPCQMSTLTKHIWL